MFELGLALLALILGGLFLRVRRSPGEEEYEEALKENEANSPDSTTAADRLRNSVLRK